MTIEEVELLRKKAKKNALIGIFSSIGLAVLVSLITKGPFLFFFIIIIGIVITSIINKKPTREFTMAFKEVFVKKSLETAFTDLVYEPEKGLNSTIIANTRMMNMGDRYTSNDFISGRYKDISIVQADVHIEEKHQTTDSDGHTTTTWVTIFRGRWMVFDFNKLFKANIQVSQKGFGNSRISNWGAQVKYKKVMMENQAFNNSFRTYAQDEHEAFYILTPALMEKIKKLTNNISGKLLFCFVDNKLHIGLQNGKDSFEHSIYKQIDEEQVTNEISKDIKLITDFVDELSLDNTLFRREV